MTGKHEQDEQMQSAAADDLLLQEIVAARVADPAPVLSGATKAAIVQAVRKNQTSISPWQRFIQSLGGGLDILRQPVTLGTLAAAAMTGVLAGALLDESFFGNGSVLPEEEFAAYYQGESVLENFYAEEMEEGR